MYSRQENIRRLNDILNDDMKKVVLGYFRADSIEDLMDQQLAFTIDRRVPRERIRKEEMLLSLVDPGKVGALLNFYKAKNIWNMTEEQLDDAIARKNKTERSFSEMFPNVPELKNPIGPMSTNGRLNSENIQRMYRFVRYMGWERKKALDSGWDRAYIDKNLPEVEYPRELVSIITNNRGGILDAWGLDEEKKKGLAKWAFTAASDEQIAKNSEKISKTFFWAFRDFDWSKPKQDEFVLDFRTPEEKTMDAFIDTNRDRLVAMREKRPLPHFPGELCRKLCDPAFLNLAGVSAESREKLEALDSYGTDSADFAMVMAFKDTSFAKDRKEKKVASAIPRNFVTPGSSLGEILRELRAENGEMVMYNMGKRVTRPVFSDYLTKTCIDAGFLKKADIDLSKFADMKAEDLAQCTEGSDAMLASIERWRRRLSYHESKGPLEDYLKQMDERSSRSLALFFTKGIEPFLRRKIREEKLEKLGVDLNVLASYYKVNTVKDLTLVQLDEAYDKKCRKLGIENNTLRYSAANGSRGYRNVYNRSR